MMSIFQAQLNTGYSKPQTSVEGLLCLTRPKWIDVLSDHAKSSRIGYQSYNVHDVKVSAQIELISIGI